MRIVFASGNRSKYEEMKAHLAPAGVELLFGGDMKGPRGIEETGETYADNALIKARAWAAATGLPALADDSGIEARALGWRPGIHSARAAEGADADRTRWLLGELADKEDRRGRFVCAIAVVIPGRSEPLCVTRRCAGTIIREPRGSSGFGYDPVFIPDGYDRTFAELGAGVKNKISHRALAAQSIAEMIKAVIK